MSAPSPTATVCFVDTNIWLYAFIASSDAHKSAEAQAVIRREPHIVISTQVINEVTVNLLKKAAFAEDDLRNLISSFYSRYQVVEFDHSILLKASELRGQHHLSFWDSLIVASALAAGASQLLSEDMHDGLVVDGRLTITNPLKPPP